MSCLRQSSHQSQIATGDTRDTGDTIERKQRLEGTYT